MDSFVLVVFGITSNLAKTKIIPVIYDLEEKHLLPKGTAIIGVARGQMSHEEFRKYFHQTLHLDNRHHKHAIKDHIFADLSVKLHYLSGDLESSQFYTDLKTILVQLGKSGFTPKNRIFYLATFPHLYKTIFLNLKRQNLTQQKSGFARLMIEKPIGHDYESAKALNKLLDSYFKEEQIFRLDHYLGKETLQNILTFRFGNGIFEPLMTKDHIDHIQITAAEEFGIGKRGSYYDPTGALKDVGQNHLIQMIAAATMDAPTEFANSPVTKERIKIIDSLVPIPWSLVRGQYASYRAEEGVPADSRTDTFFAFKTQIKNDRFSGVPIYVRAGKKLSQTVTEVCIIFKTPINRLFKHLRSGAEPNVLIYRIQPNEGIVLRILSKKPSHSFELDSTYMQFCYSLPTENPNLPDAYENLIFDAMRGDATFFNDAPEVEASWKFIDRLSVQKSPPSVYEDGSWGPKKALALLERDGRSWLSPSALVCNRQVTY